MTEGVASVGGGMAGGFGAGAKWCAELLPITRRRSFLTTLAALSVSYGCVCVRVCEGAHV